MKKVTYLTGFNTFGRDAYAFVATEKGYFREAGFDVTIQPGTGTVDVLKLVASGRADYGVGDFQAGVLTIANENLPVKAVTAIQDKSLSAIATVEGYGISSPADLEGKQIADQAGSTNQLMFPVYAKAAGVDPSKVTFVPSSPASLPQLLASHKVDAIGQFVVAEGLIERATNGKKAVFLPFSDYLPDLYGTALMTSEKTLAEKPKEVAAFSAALLKGLKYSLANPEEAGEILKKHVPTQDAAVAADEIKVMTPYVGTQNPNGSFSKSRVQTILDMFSKANALNRTVQPSDVAAFTIAE
ncbi:ABC transporter substrate-binding protein [Paenarthrobacter sp. NPDC056912]|uniref:ABC transporter substrate-binding protein n=1 Tax=Paenarthrobacter sp. NPDC056912 TaxID=3345965 RepID=UPI00366AED90